jgi:hypothetical protein
VLSTVTVESTQLHCGQRRNESAEAQRVRELCPCCQQAAETTHHFLADAMLPWRSRGGAAQPREQQQQQQQLQQPSAWAVAGFVVEAWKVRNTALTRRGASGGNATA